MAGRVKYTEMLGCCSAVLIFVLSAFSQSNDVNFPTPLTSTAVNATIKPRDIGDGRLTTYYYAFGGDQGDVFINVVTKNFDGDIDVFTADNMKPLTKMVIYSDSSANETGRLIYLRKTEKLLLRIEGRPPDDRPAIIQVKFGGSFVAMKGGPGSESQAPTVAIGEQGNVRVNSVGTIISVPEVKKPEVKVPSTETVAATPKKETKKPLVDDSADKEKKTPTGKTPKPGKPKVVVTDSVAEKETTKEKEPQKPKTTVEKKPKPKNTAKVEKTDALPEKEKIDPLANIRLVVAFKNGDKLERPLAEVLKFSVDKGVLTVIAKDGSIRRYSMLDVAEVTIK